MGGIRPLFGMDMIRNFVEDFVEQANNDIVEILQYAGEEFVNRARDNRTYMDDTGNLRSSIGYIILNNGRIVYKNFTQANGKGSEGVEKANKFALELSSNYPEGYVLIGVAGMEYAAAVERYHGLDVISASASKVEDDIKEIIKEIQQNE